LAELPAVHPPLRKTFDSKYLPDPDGGSPRPGWKRLEVVQEAIAPADRLWVSAAGGVIDMGAYGELVAKGEGRASAALSGDPP
jgi:uncharacterized protein